MSISDWSSDVCSSDLSGLRVLAAGSQLETPTGALHDQPRQGHCEEQEVDGPAVDEQRLTDDGDVVQQRHRDLARPVGGQVDRLEQEARHAKREDVEGQPHHRAETHTSDIKSLMRISYAVFC